MHNQEIKKLETANFDDAGSTVSVTVESDTQTETFHVQTVDGEYRSDLGCWILTDYSEGDIDYDDYPRFNLPGIIKAAEIFLQSEIEEESTMYIIDGEYVYLLITDDDVKLVTMNNKFTNKDQSPYQRKFSDPIKTFASREEAIEYLENL